MFENICSLPLRADIFTQAIHPTQPIFAVGLSSGHVQTFRLPPLHESASPVKSLSTSINKPSALSSKVRNGRRSSDTGFGLVDKVWETRRHKGSCRTLCLSEDGEVLYSAGTDGIVKAANMESGSVVGKVAIPLHGYVEYTIFFVGVVLNIFMIFQHHNFHFSNTRLTYRITPDEPSVIHALTPQTLLLGTDSGLLHLYDLRADSSSSTASPFTHTRPSQSHTPHTPKDDPTPDTEPITSLTPLPPTTASTSGTSRTWISTAGSTLAVTDLRKGIVTLSEDQGDMLLSSACVSGLSLSKSAKRRRAAASSNNEASGLGSGEKVIVGAAGGVVTVWERGEWRDHTGRIKVAGDSSVEPAIPSGTRGFGAEAHDDDCTVDVLEVVPEWVDRLEGKARGGRLAVAGLGNGGIRVMRLRGGGGEVIGGMRHDEGGVEGVITLGFEREGRLISGGGQVVKVWEVGRGGEGDYHEEIEIGGAGGDEDDDDADDDDDEL